jgi:hypothetical protein
MPVVIRVRLNDRHIFGGGATADATEHHHHDKEKKSESFHN